MTVESFEESVWKVDGIRIVVRAPSGTEVEDYSYQRADTASRRITEWLETRVYPKVGSFEVVVLDGRGAIPHGNNQMGTIRDTYRQ